jgi:hypothetical protein
MTQPVTGPTNTYHRPWSTVDTEELKLLKELEETVRTVAAKTWAPRTAVELLDRLAKLPVR